MLPLRADNVRMDLEQDGTFLKLKIQGEIDMKEPAIAIRPFLEQVHAHMIHNGGEEIEVDFTRLGFMNSSGIKEFVSWIMKLNGTPIDQKYTMLLTYSGSVTWQESSIPVLQKLQPNYIKMNRV